MPTAYVLINCRLGEEARIIGELRKIRGVSDAHGVYGIYDIIAEVEGGGTDELKEIITYSIRRISGILSTNTLIIVKGQG
jgi:DNA-binding Lrp family transcriptional regulator